MARVTKITNLITVVCSNLLDLLTELVCNIADNISLGAFKQLRLVHPELAIRSEPAF